ncbi:4-hydroxy-2-oxovalerate aldolase [Legionella londiniensis]|uniref:4-hydroxy-2-oxovalerate aldolase n=1 Tax=Legionella londiniensis TaxID=45068 RepID=A0A0W0VPJ6_9GAMM|nr:4-hydroxy-2-oxovalerate aldolase [Legionella londiniensis]KTD21976.1 4-hydroxy-2-oxovalerate aldolase [Legionella londiniensis]STX94018.1 4-hydroxy-2-ketovalerate aldolase [Legionella londiniensis]
MNTLKTIDVTLRDGGNRINFHFNDETLHHILPLLDKSGIEYIEIGYRNGAICPMDGIGKAGLCPKDFLLDCRSLIKNSNIAVMAHPQNLSPEDIQELKACGVDLLRICVSRGQADKALPVIQESKNEGLEVSVNFIHASQYSEQDLDKAVKTVSESQPDMIYFADSNGSLLPETVEKLYKRYVGQFAVSFGFHAHDNLGLAQANTIAAIRAGAKYIDYSLAGMGKGIGNLRTEFFAAYLRAIKARNYDLDAILKAANYMRKAFNAAGELVQMDEFTRGIYDLSTAEIKLDYAKNLG